MSNSVTARNALDLFSRKSKLAIWCHRQERAIKNSNTVWRKTFGEENFRKFWGFVAIRESFSREIRGRGILWRGNSKQSAKVFFVKIVFFTNLRKFSPSKVSHYMVYHDLPHVLQTDRGSNLSTWFRYVQNNAYCNNICECISHY